MLDTSFKISLGNINNIMVDTDGVTKSKKYPEFPMQQAEASGKHELISNGTVFKPTPSIPLYLDPQNKDKGWSGDELFLISNQAAYDASDHEDVVKARGGEPPSDLAKDIRNFAIRLYQEVADKAKGLVERKVNPSYDLDGDGKLQMYEFILMDLNKDGYIDNTEIDKVDEHYIKCNEFLQLNDHQEKK